MNNIDSVYYSSKVGLECCRICLNQNSNLDHNLFDPAGPAASEMVADRIQFCTGIQLANEEGLPSKICELCYQNMLVAHHFKNLCLLSEDRLKKVEISIKSEVDKAESDFENDGDICDIDIDVKKEIKEDTEDVGKSDCLIIAKKIRKSIEDIVKKPVRKKCGPYKKTKDQNKIKKDKKFILPPLTCILCNIKFTTRQEHLAHRQEVHKSKDDFFCEVCGKVFNTGSRYAHIRSHLPPQYSCDRCDYQTWHKSDLKKHIYVHDNIKPYSCPQCPALFRTASGARSHDRRTHQRLRPHRCAQCGSRFECRTKLQRHLDSHDNIKRYTCDICHSSYTRRCYWKKHLQTQHGIIIPGQRPGRQNVQAVSLGKQK